jgi:hypothetical protein
LSERDFDKDFEAFSQSFGDSVSVEDTSKLDLGEDWLDRVYSGKEQLNDAFVEYDAKWFLVGHGEKKNDKCAVFMRRKVKKLKGCLRVHNHAGMHVDGVDYTDKIYAKRVFYSCNRPECPSCGVSAWATKEAGRAEARLKYIAAKFGVKFQHIILSPPHDLGLSDEGLKKYILKACLRRGITGGLVVYHHFRYHGKDEAYVGEKAHYYKGSHFHILGVIQGGYGNCRTCSNNHRGEYVYDTDKCKNHCNGYEGVTRRAYEKDGVIAKVKDERKSLGGTVWYELSHASLKRGAKKHVVVNWFGEFGRNKLKLLKGGLPQKENLCKICGEKLYDILFKGDYKSLLRFMSCSKESQGFILDYKDENGVVQWSAVHPEDG